MASAEEPTQAEVLGAMSRAAGFMMDTLSHRGGFVWKYSRDLSERYGELKARDSMIWVEPPGTPTVGMMWIDAYRVTGDRKYLRHAERVADALVEGQLPCGGWHYFIDFDESGVKRHYEEFFSRRWAWQEYLHYYGNATFDDDVTTSATRFLLGMQTTPSARKYRAPLDKALDFIRRAQYPNGAWPQRFPPRGKFSFGGRPDYTSHYTFNDDVAANAIDVLLEAHRTLGDDACRQAARRGMNFYLAAQLPEPQAGWAQQYDLEMKLAWGRTFEPPAVCSSQTIGNIADLMRFYKCTGDRRYLEPIPRALDWLRRAADDTELGEPYTHTCFYELGTNRPIFIRRTGSTVDDVVFEIVYSPDDRTHPYGLRYRLDLDAVRDKYARVAALSAAEARAEFEKEIAGARPRIKAVSGGSDCRLTAGSPGEIRELIETLGDGSGWVVKNEVLDIDDFRANPPYVFEGYDTGTYTARMYRLMDYLKTQRIQEQ